MDKGDASDEKNDIDTACTYAFHQPFLIYDDCKIYPVTEDYSIALAFIPGSAGGSSRYELRVISDEKLSLVVSVGSVGSKEYRYLGKTSGVDVYYGDFTFDGIPDIARIQDTELFLRV